MRQRVDLVFGLGNRTYPVVYQTSILAIDPSLGLVVSQPEQRIPKAAEGQQIVATVIKRNPKSNEYSRIGFDTTIKAFLTVERAGRTASEAVILTFPEEVRRVNLRFSYRAILPSSLTPPIFLADDEGCLLARRADLVDLSAGGALIRLPYSPDGTPRLRPGRTVFLDMDMSHLVKRFTVRLYASQADLSHFRIPCRIVRAHRNPELRRSYIGLAFLHLSERQVDLLHAVLIKTQQFIAANWGLSGKKV